MQKRSLREKCPYSEFFWSVLSCIRTEYRESPNAGKYRPEKLRMQTLFTQCYILVNYVIFGGGIYHFISLIVIAIAFNNSEFIKSFTDNSHIATRSIYWYFKEILMLAC